MTKLLGAVMALVLLVLLALLAGCGPVDRGRPNAGAPPDNLVALVLYVNATPQDALATVKVNATDLDGRANNRQGQTYPFEVIRRTPWSHVHYYEPGLIIKMTADVFIAGDVGEVVHCYFEDNGVEQVQTRQTAQILPGRTQAGVQCTYTTKAVPPA